MGNSLRIWMCLTALVATVLAGCSDDPDGCTNPAAVNYDPTASVSCCCVFPNDGFSNVVFQFEHVFNGFELTFEDTVYELRDSSHIYSIDTLQYFISDITLHRADSNDVFIDDVHYIDARIPSTLNWAPNVELPLGQFTGITFTFGLDTAKNVEDFFSDPPEANMAWPQAFGDGYHYMKLHGHYDSLGLDTAFYPYFTDFGPSLNTPYFFKVSLPNSGFQSLGITQVVTIEMSVNEWYNNPNDYDFELLGPFIWGDQVAQQFLRENGANVFSLESIVSQF